MEEERSFSEQVTPVIEGIICIIFIVEKSPAKIDAEDRQPHLLESVVTDPSAFAKP
jgi:hypothetical protein